MTARLRLVDALALSALGLRARRVRSSLSALGVAIAVAALVAVLGIAASSTAELLTQLGEQGNLLTVAAGQTFNGNPTPLPLTAEPMIRRIPPVLSVTAVGTVFGTTVRRTPAIPPLQTSGISVLAAEPSLAATMSMRMLTGRFLDPASGRYPETVLGRSAAENLGITGSSPTTLVYLGGRYFTVIGILEPVDTAPAGRHEVDEYGEVLDPGVSLREELLLEPLQPSQCLIHAPANLGKAPAHRNDLPRDPVAHGRPDLPRE